MGVQSSYDHDPRRFDLTRAVAPTGQCTSIGTFTTFAGTHVHEISVAVDDSSFSVAKHYTFSPLYDQFPAGVVLRPERDSGPFGLNNFELIAIVSLGVVTYRLRRTGGATAGTYRVHIKNGGRIEDTFAPSTAVVNPCVTVYPLEPVHPGIGVGGGVGGGIVFYGSSDFDSNKFAQVGSNHTKESNIQPAVVPSSLTVTRVTITCEDQFTVGTVNTLIIRKNGPATTPIATLTVTQAQQVFVVSMPLVQGDTINVSGTNTSGTKMKNTWISLV